MNRARWINTMQARQLIQANPQPAGAGPADWRRDTGTYPIPVIMTTPPDEDNEDGVPEDVLVTIAPPVPGVDHTLPAAGRGRHRGVHRPWWRFR